MIDDGKSLENREGLTGYGALFSVTMPKEKNEPNELQAFIHIAFALIFAL